MLEGVGDRRERAGRPGAVAVDPLRVAGRERPRAAVERVRLGDVAPQEKAGVARRVRLGVHAAHREQRLDLRRRPQRPPVVGDVERLDPVGVAGQQQPGAVGVPEREREHAPEVLDERRPLLLVEPEQDLGVRRRPEAVALPLEVALERLVVVDLAVEDDRHRPALAPGRHRLGAALGEVDDREPAVPQADAAVGPRPRPLGVRPARRHPVARGRERRRVGGGRTVGELGGDATHGLEVLRYLSLVICPWLPVIFP